MNVLETILARKRVEVARRLRHATRFAHAQMAEPEDRASFAIERLRRNGSALPKVIAEIKFRSPSAGVIRRREPHAVQAIALGYVQGGASAVSVLCDGPGFGGTPLDVRRAASVVECPVLFKEFVLDSVQIELARQMGAHMVLLLVKALTEPALHALVAEAEAAGVAPVVEAADEQELAVALRTSATIVGVNARDLRSFSVDSAQAMKALERVPESRVAVHMSGVRSAQDLRALANGRADAVLVGEGLMRATSPSAELSKWLAR